MSGCMNASDIGKPIRIVMKDGFAKTGKLKSVNQKSITIEFQNGDTEEIFLDFVSSIKVNNNGWLHGGGK